jgi:hypothetical protein
MHSDIEIQHVLLDSYLILCHLKNAVTHAVLGPWVDEVRPLTLEAMLIVTIQAEHVVELAAVALIFVDFFYLTQFRDSEEMMWLTFVALPVLEVQVVR